MRWTFVEPDRNRVYDYQQPNPRQITPQNKSITTNWHINNNSPYNHPIRNQQKTSAYRPSDRSPINNSLRHARQPMNFSPMNNTENLQTIQQYQLLERDEPEQKPDYPFESSDNFYGNLKVYEPFVCCKDSSPIFLVNEDWWWPALGILLFDGLFLMAFLKFVLDDRKLYENNGDDIREKMIKPPNFNLMRILCIVQLVLINLSYLLTQFLNPGIRNPAQIQPQQFELRGKEYCHQCSSYRTGDMTHCRQCQVCIQGFDHHCGFFNKCIGGKQKVAFYFFLFFMFTGFLVLLVAMSIELSV